MDLRATRWFKGAQNIITFTQRYVITIECIKMHGLNVTSPTGLQNPLLRPIDWANGYIKIDWL